jgi:hypothetical protein
VDSPAPQSRRELPSYTEVTLRDHLTVSQLSQALEPLRIHLETHPAAVQLLFDCRTMTGYDRAARQLFVEWHRNHMPSNARIAIVVAHPLWHLVISTMALASGRAMRPFSDKHSALVWLAAA